MLRALLGCLGSVLFAFIYGKRPAMRLVAKRGRPALRRVAVFADRIRIVLLFTGLLLAAAAISALSCSAAPSSVEVVL